MIISFILYSMIFAMFFLGIHMVCASKDMIKQLFGLSVMQSAVIIFFVALGYVKDSAAPVIKEGIESYSNPIPHVLMLTAIVVGVAVFSVGLSLAIQVQRNCTKSNND